MWHIKINFYEKWVRWIINKYLEFYKKWNNVTNMWWDIQIILLIYMLVREIEKMRNGTLQAECNIPYILVYVINNML